MVHRSTTTIIPKRPPLAITFPESPLLLFGAEAFLIREERCQGKAQE